MSVNSKMTAIADIFRALGSIEYDPNNNDTKFSLDEMAQYLEYIRTTIEQAYELAISKGGIPSNPSRAPIMNLAECVYNIPIEGATVRRKEGTFATGPDGTASVNCGFQPDVVLFTGLFLTTNGYSYECHPAIVFSEQKQSSYYLFTTGQSNNFPYGINFTAMATDNGFGVQVLKNSSNGTPSPALNTEFQYVAIKYT